MALTSFLKKIHFPKFDFHLASGSASFVGVDIGSGSVKVVQLRKEREQAVLETYGELKSERYFQKETSAALSGFLSHRDENMANLLTDVMRESNVTSRRAVFSIPSASSFITVINFPLIRMDEIEAAIPYEAKRYIPVPTSEVNLDWQVIEQDETEKRVSVLLAAVPLDVISKYQRIADTMHLDLEGVEIESFSSVRSLLYNDRGVTALINWGAVVTTVTVVDQRIIRLNHNFSRGSWEITTALARSLGVSEERAEAMKKEVGLSERPEEREIADIIIPMADSLLMDAERVITSYNRAAKRKVGKIVLTGGGVGLKGFTDHVARHFGLETAIGNPFQRTVFPEFLQPVLRDLAPNFGVAVGLALRPIASS
mgnify:CR=1 FL=1